MQKVDLYLSLAPNAVTDLGADELEWQVKPPQRAAWAGGTLDELRVDESKYEENSGTGGVFTGAAKPAGAAQGGSPGEWKFLRSWLALLEREGQLNRISAARGRRPTVAAEALSSLRGTVRLPPSGRHADVAALRPDRHCTIAPPRFAIPAGQ